MWDTYKYNIKRIEENDIITKVFSFAALNRSNIINNAYSTYKMYLYETPLRGWVEIFLKAMSIVISINQT